METSILYSKLQLQFALKLHYKFNPIYNYKYYL